MQQHVYGYPSPPASPACAAQPQFPTPRQQQRHFQPRCVPLAPEQRLGKLLESKLQLHKILGTGAYGVVYQASDIETGVQYAIKCLSKLNADGTPLDRRQMAYQRREIHLHYQASAHPNVVSMHKIVEDPDCVYVILEFCPEGDLFSNITERGQYVGRDELARSIFLQILDAVEYCHSLGIYHRDLKPENILVTDNGNTVKLADFGLAIAEEASEDYGCGSTFYMSPECLDPSATKPYYACAPNDVWSLGVVLVNLTCGRNPWKQASFQDSTYRAYAHRPDFLKTILPLTDGLNDILGSIFTADPEKRITLPDLRARIMSCPAFTAPAPSYRPITPPLSPVDDGIASCYSGSEYDEDAIIDDFDIPLSPVSDDEGSLASGLSDDDEDFDEGYEITTPVSFSPPCHDFPSCGIAQDKPQEVLHSPLFQVQPVFPEQACVPQHYTGPVPASAPVVVPTLRIPQPPQHQMPTQLSPISQAPCHQTKPPFPVSEREFTRYVQQAQMMQMYQQRLYYPGVHHQQGPTLPAFAQGVC